MCGIGGQNIRDGGVADNILAFVNEFGLGLVETKVDLNHFYFTGEKFIPLQDLLNQKQFNPENLKTRLNELAQQAGNMRDVLNGILNKDDPLYKAMEVRLSGYEGGPIEKLSPLYCETLYHMLLGGVSAAHPHLEEDNQIHLLSIKGGNALLPEKLAQTLKSRLHLNMPLVDISKEHDGSFLLTFKEGQKVKADILVLAIPCSVYEEIVFQKNVLPLERLEAIKNVHYGTNAKIVIPFTEVPSTKAVCLNDRALGFFDANQSGLILYYTGEASRFSSKTILETYKQERKMIEEGYGKECPPFVAPVHGRDESFAIYEGPIGYSWPNDPFVKGTYSYIATGQDASLTAMSHEQGESVKTLFAPINQKLYFAGEHTSILTEVPGTMEAACESGERAARMILNSYRNLAEPTDNINLN